nr:probable aspartyl protease At4g16563 [Tanacetum cinerariifolium]
MSFSLRSSQLPVTLYMDTGSDLVWVPCKPFTCIMCEGKSDPQTTPLPHDIHVNSSFASPVTCLSRASHVRALSSIARYLLLISARCLDALWTPLRCPSVKTTRVLLSTMLTVTATLLESCTM